MTKQIALLGNPNSGKTSIFNILTGSTAQVGNWPGVTVERKSGRYKKDKSLALQDLPGVYSLSPYSPEEAVTRDYLVQTPPDALIDIVDSTNLERSLYLTLQLIELGQPIVVALNMSDLMAREGRRIDVEKLSYSLGLPVVETSALKNKGLDALVKTSLSAEKAAELLYDQRLESALSEIGTVTGITNRGQQIQIFENADAADTLQLTADKKADIEEIVAITERILSDDRKSILVNERYSLISQIVSLTVTDTSTRSSNLTDKIDRVVTSKWLGLPIFIFVMWLVYFLSIQTVGTIATNWINDTFFGEILPQAATHLMQQAAIVPWLQQLVLNGIIAGLGAILGFIPQIFVLFLCLGALEDSGYMARVAFVMDRIFRRFGLSGKSFIPMLIASGCGVPGIMATRTIEQERDRRITIMVTTFMPCSAKLPIIALVSGAFFPHNPWIAPSSYFLGMGMIVLSGIMLKKIKLFAGDRSAFIMELPNYHLPHAATVLKYAFDKALSFIRRAGTVIFVINVFVWLLSNYSWTLAAVSPDKSMLSSIGRVLAWVFTPLGFGDWRATVATFTGLAAKETIVGTFGVLYAGGHSLTASFAEHYTALGAYAFLAFNLLCAPCIASISTIFKEMGSVSWGLRAVGFQTAVAYAIAFIIYQFGNLIAHATIGVGTVFAFAVVVFGLYLLFRKEPMTKELLA